MCRTFAAEIQPHPFPLPCEGGDREGSKTAKIWHIYIKANIIMSMIIAIVAHMNIITNTSMNIITNTNMSTIMSTSTTIIMRRVG